MKPTPPELDRIADLVHSQIDRVYIVTVGEYSDYRILAVFAHQEQALAFKADKPNAEIEMWLLGSPVDDYRLVWNVSLDATTGGMLKDRSGSIYDMKPRDWSQGIIYTCEGSPIVMGLSTISADHALKVAAEKRQEWLRLRQLK